VKLGSGSRCVEIGPRGVGSWPLRDEIGTRTLGSDRDRVEIVPIRSGSWKLRDEIARDRTDRGFDPA
jgi:hypothetical protein